MVLTFDATCGNERFRADLKHFSGLLMVLSLCATFFPLASVSIQATPDGVESGTPAAKLIGGLIIIIIGLIGMSTGYLGLVHDFHHRYLTGLLLIWIQFAYIPYITDMVGVVQDATTDNKLIPDFYSPTQGQKNTVAFFGVVGVLGFGMFFIGSLAFVAFSLYSYQRGNPEDRPSRYYRGRLGFYSVVLIILGIAQFALGSFCTHNFGPGPLDKPITVAMFTITYPEIAIFVGIIYFINGTFGLMRTLGLVETTEHDHIFQICMAVQYFWTLVLMILSQVAYLPGGDQAAAAPSRACLTLGAHILPAYLDFMMRTTPDIIPPNYYGLQAVAKSRVGGSIDMDEDEDVV